MSKTEAMAQEASIKPTLAVSVIFRFLTPGRNKILFDGNASLQKSMM
jgi:hypothetical protein